MSFADDYLSCLSGNETSTTINSFSKKINFLKCCNSAAVLHLTESYCSIFSRLRLHSRVYLFICFTGIVQVFRWCYNIICVFAKFLFSKYSIRLYFTEIRLSFRNSSSWFFKDLGVLRRLGKALVKFKDRTNQAIPSNPAREFLGSLYRSSAVEYISFLAVISRVIHVTYPHHFSCDLPCRRN